MKIGVINGPNINILGKREVRIYGKESWDKIEEKLKLLGKTLNLELLFYQSNHEGEIVDYIQTHMDDLDGIIINPAAFSKTGYSILDAINANNLPYIEIHLSNIFFRGGWHSESIFTEDAIGFIGGFQGYGYELALRGIHQFLDRQKE